MLCLWCDQSEFMAVFMVFNLWIVSGFIFVPCIQFFNTYHNKLLCQPGPVIGNHLQSKESTRLGVVLLENRTGATFQNVILVKKN